MYSHTRFAAHTFLHERICEMISPRQTAKKLSLPGLLERDARCLTEACLGHSKPTTTTCSSYEFLPVALASSVMIGFRVYILRLVHHHMKEGKDLLSWSREW